MPNEETIQKMSIVDPIQVNVNIPNFEGKPGRDGTDGRDGDDAYRIAVRNGFLGTEKEWLLTLKGQSASTPLSRQALLKNNIWCENDTPDSVIAALISNWGKPMPRTEFKPLALETTLVVGLKDLTFSGEPHYKLKVGSKDPVEFNTNGSANVTIESSNAGDSVSVQYLGYSNNVVSNKVYTFGDIGNIFKVGNLIESHEFDNPNALISSDEKLLVSIYDNKVVTMTLANGANDFRFTDNNQLSEINTWILSKISKVETVIVDATITKAMANVDVVDSINMVNAIIGYGVNLKIDISKFNTSSLNGIIQIFYNTGTDTHARPYIGKFIQINDSNIFLVKQNMNGVNYLVNDNSIVETTDSL